MATDSCQKLENLGFFWRILGFEKKIELQTIGEPAPVDEGYVYTVKVKKIVYYWLGIKIKEIV